MRLVFRCALRSLLAMAAALPLPAPAQMQPAAAQRSTKITFDRHSLLIDGRRVFLWGGEFHAFRLPSPDLWRDVLQKMKASGYNSVTLPFAWGYHSAKPGAFDFKGVRDMDRLLKIAAEVGLYVIVRPGPYVDAGLSRGGLPGWMAASPGRARSDDPAYQSAADTWLTRINRIVAANQLSTGQGTVVLYEIEHGLPAVAPTHVRHLRHLHDKARADGISVPIFHTDRARDGFWVPRSSEVPGTVPGPVDLYAFAADPGGRCTVGNAETDVGPAPNLGLHGLGGAAGGASASPATPGFAAEFGGGRADHWGSNGSDPCTLRQRGPAYQRLFYGTNIANGITLQSFAATVGGTSWGWLPAPDRFTSDDAGAAIGEARDLRETALAMKSLGQFVYGLPELAKLEKAPPVAVSAPGVEVLHDRNPETDARLLFVRHAPERHGADDRFNIVAALPDGSYTLPQEGTLRLAGADAKLLIAGINLQRQRLVYSTSELQTYLPLDGEDLALFHGRPGEAGETVLRFATRPRVTVLAGEVRETWDEVRRDLRLNYAHDGLARVRIEGGGPAPLTLLIADDAAARGFWRQETSLGPVLEHGPALVRTATVAGTTLALTGDTAAPTALEVWAPAALRRLSWNGARLDIDRTPALSMRATAPLPGPEPVTLPDLTAAAWRFQPGTPEAAAAFDDSDWTAADQPPRADAIVRPPVGQPDLGMDSYGFHSGDVWYRGRFTGDAAAERLTLHYGGGGAGLLQLWLDGRFIGQHELGAGLPQPLTTGIARFELPAEARTAGEHVLAVMVRNTGHNRDAAADDAHKEPRGLISAAMDTQAGPSFAVPIAWRIRGGDAADPARGPLNNGGLNGEREGWHLPGFPDDRWGETQLPAAQPLAGTSWYRTEFDLDLPRGHDTSIGLQFGDPSRPRSPVDYRVLIFVNGWNMGQFVAHLGPQRSFVLPEGILDHHGRNTLALAVTSDGAPGNALEPVRLVVMRHLRGGVPVARVAAPGWRRPPR